MAPTDETSRSARLSAIPDVPAPPFGMGAPGKFRAWSRQGGAVKRDRRESFMQERGRVARGGRKGRRVQLGARRCERRNKRGAYLRARERRRWVKPGVKELSKARGGRGGSRVLRYGLVANEVGVEDAAGGGS